MSGALRSEDWERVADSGSSHRAFLRPAWFQAWEAAYGDERNWRRPVRYISVATGSSQGILPVATQRIGPFRFASLCGGYFPFRAIPFVGDAASLAPSLVAAMRAIAGVAGARLGPTPSDDPMMSAIVSELARSNWRIRQQNIGEEYVLENPGSLDAFKAGLSSNRRKKVDYYWRKLCDQGPTELVHFNNAGAAWSKVFSDIRTIEAASWVATSGDPRFVGARNEKFWALISADAWFSRALNVWLIYHAAEPVSFALTIDAGSTRYVIANSFDERVAKFSTGAKIYQQLIFDAFSKNLARVNIGLGDSGYKSGWGAQVSCMLVDVVAFPPTLKGSLAYFAAWMKDRVNQLRHRGEAA